MNRKITLDLEKEICEQYLLGDKSQKVIASEYNLNQGHISKILKRNNIKHLPKYRLNSGRLNVNVSFFENIDDKITAYWYGYVLADGTINRSNNKCSLTSKDYEIIDRFKRDIKSDHKILINNQKDKRTNKKYKTYTIQITNQNFVLNLIKNGITNNKTNVAIVPNIDNILLPFFFAGLFDGDGYVGIVNNYSRVSLISTKEILLFLQNYLITNLSCGVTKLQRVTKNKENVWKLLLYKDSLKFLNWIYQDDNFDYLERKYKIYETIK
jgi:hypothetical protein